MAEARITLAWMLNLEMAEEGELSNGVAGGECGEDSASSNGMCELNNLETGELGALVGEKERVPGAGEVVGDLERRSRSGGERSSRPLRKEGRLRKDMAEEDLEANCCGVGLPKSASKPEIHVCESGRENHSMKSWSSLSLGHDATSEAVIMADGGVEMGRNEEEGDGAVSMSNEDFGDCG